MGDNDIIKNSIIKIESLEKEYDIVLKQYEEAYKNYINSLNTYSQHPCKGYNFQSTGISQECYNKIWADQGCTTKAQDVTSNWGQSQTYDSLVKDSYLWATLTDETHRKGCYGDTTKYNTNTKPTYSLGSNYAELPGRAWWGTYGIKEGTANTKDECISMCASDINCSGATFNNVKRYCWARGGDGTISIGKRNDNALIPQLKVNIITLNKINDQLMSINQQLRNEIQNISPKLKQEKTSYSKKQQEFDNYYNNLSNEKKKLQDLLAQYHNVESELYDQTLVVDQANTSMRLWSILALLLLLIILKQAYDIETFNNRMKYIIIILVLVILSFMLSKPSGFVTISFILLAIIVYKINNGTEEIV